jgi:hypothetical protein
VTFEHDKTDTSKQKNKFKKLKNKKLDVKTKSDQLLLDIFANSSEVLNTNQNSNNEIPEFIPNPVLRIDDTLFKSMEILTNDHFGPNILKPEE